MCVHIYMILNNGKLFTCLGSKDVKLKPQSLKSSMIILIKQVNVLIF